MEKKRLRLIVPLVIVLAGSVGLVTWLVTRDNRANDVLTTSGTIEATDVPVAAEVAGKVAAVLVEEGQRVRAGEPLAKLDTTALSIQLEQARAALKMAQARLAEAQAGPRAAQVRQTDELARQASAALEGAQKNFDTVKQLYDQGVAPKTQLDAATTALDTARAQAKAARAQADLVKQGATAEQLKQLEAQVEQASASVKLAEWSLDRATVKAPVDGSVIRRLVEPGALISPGATLATLSNPEDLWLRVYVPENQLSLVKVGMEAQVEVDSYPGRRFRAKVVSISDQAEFTPRNVQTKQERATTVYAVKLRLDEGLRGELKAGMPADVTFATPSPKGK
ncbi:MAG: HlyD family secretion protein [Chitinophagales bacterium]